MERSAVVISFPQASRGYPRPAPRRPATLPGRRPPIRLTRRGRVVLLALLLAVAATITILLASASRAADPAGAPRTAVVQRDDTLWSIAAREVPGGDPFTTIERIRFLNDLPDYPVHPGQTLIRPGE